MAKKKSTKKALLASVLALTLSSSMLVGTTFAWFTDSVTSSNNVIQTGSLKVGMYYANGDENPASVTWKDAEQGTIFNNDKWEPGYVEARHIKIVNEGSLALKYKLLIVPNGMVEELADVIDVYFIPTAQQITRESLASLTPVGTLRDLIEDKDGMAHGALLPNGETTTSVYERAGEVTATIALKMRESAGNEYQNKKIGTDFAIQLLATQYTYEADAFDKYYDENAEYPPMLTTVDAWDGTADTSWYDPENPKTEYEFSTAEQLAGLAELVSGSTTFEGVTFKLTQNLDLYCEDTTPNADGDPLTFRPIGDHSKDGTFEGIFDGNGKTIANIYQNGWDLGYDWYNYGSYGLFGNVNNATVKNLTLSGGESYIEGGDTSFVAGSATGTCVFENITIEDSVSATYNNGNGGIIGWSGAGNYTFKNITIAEDCVLAGLWGSFDSSIGGIVGQAEPGATYNFENVEVSCRIDAYNDCTASYDYYNYRMCGMLIGRLAETTTIDGTNYPDMSKYNITCKKVTVNYGDWMNYHYCEPTPGLNGGRGMRVEPGYAYDGLPSDYDHSQCVDNHMNLIPFDQIFGGAQLGVKGLKTYDGVTVVYPN
ncbi:MAG: hypothetical protein E7381_05600 [Clostridiales bacterium]|nr:hypothetical protein [Clostridiales bacterium]